VIMGERCTVFIESDIIHQQHRTAQKSTTIAGGLCYSIVANYLNKVVGDRRIGKKIFFQGGTAFNQGVVAAFEKTLKGERHQCTSPPRCNRGHRRCHPCYEGGAPGKKAPSRASISAGDCTPLIPLNVKAVKISARSERLPLKMRVRSFTEADARNMM
jgi:hypothetical protein